MSTPISEVFHIDQWQNRIGRSAPSKWGNRALGTIIGPRDACMLVELRRMVRGYMTFGDPVPTDFFLLGIGEPPSRDRTKIGGLPFWPRSRPWPHSAAHVPLPFLAQFNFRGSRDIVGELPADILLLFGHKNEPSEIVAVWQSSKCREPLVGPDDMPITPVTPCLYGTRWRTESYLDGRWPDDLILEDGSRVLEPWLLCEPLGLKIGASYFLISRDEQLSTGERIVCSMCALPPQPGVPWQFTNRAEPLTESEAEQLTFELTGHPPDGFAVVSVAITPTGEPHVMSLEYD